MIPPSALLNRTFRRIWLASLVSGTAVAAHETAATWTMNLMSPSGLFISLMASLALPFIRKKRYNRMHKVSRDHLRYIMERNLPRASRGGLLILSRVGKLAVILGLALFAIQPVVWARTKAELMECTMQDGKIVDKSGHLIGDCVLMKDGHMMMISKGKMTPIKKDITLADGTVCKADGTCIVKSGKQIKLTNGEGIEVAGEKLFLVKGLVPPGSRFQ